MKKVLFLLFYLFALSCPIASAEIIQTPTLAPIEAALEKADPYTLVIFDMDDVLLMPQDQILKKQNKPYLEELERKLEQRIGEAEAQILYSLIFMQRHNNPVDKKMIILIGGLQDKGMKVLALTNCFTGKFGKIDSMEKWRISELRRMEYDFEKSWKGIEPHRFEGLSKTGHGLSEKSGSPAAFAEGVVFASSISKGEALKAFLAYTNFTPKKIIFIDDKKKHLESVEAAANSLGIPFVGIEYTAVKDSKIKPLNKTLANLQFDVLEKEHKWLGDEEADKILKARSSWIQGK